MDETVLETNSNNEAISDDSSKSSSSGIHFNENVFNEFQKKIKTEIMNSLYPNVLEDNFDDVEDNFDYLDNSIPISQTFHNETIINTYHDESKSCTTTSLNKNENNNDAVLNNSDLNISKSNLQGLENSNSAVSSSHNNKMSTDTSISKREILLKSKLPIPLRLFKMNHICSDYCTWCKQCFAVLDTPNHIGLLKNVETAYAFLKIEPSLDIVSCICDRCWKFLKRTYEKQKGIYKKRRHITHIPNNVTEINVNNSDRVNSRFEMRYLNRTNDESTVRAGGRYKADYKSGPNEEFRTDSVLNKSVNSNKLYKRSKKKKKKKRSRRPSITCSVHNCFKNSAFAIPSDECKRIKQIFSQFDFNNIILIESRPKKTKHFNIPCLSVCEEHSEMIDLITRCQMCGGKLKGHLNSEEWKMYDNWNKVLLCNNFPLELKPGMFLCATCQNYISNPNSLKSVIIMEDLKQDVIYRNNIRKKLFGYLPQINIPNISQESNVHSLNDAVHKDDNPVKVKFTEPLITATHYFKRYKIEHFKKSEKKKFKCTSEFEDLFIDSEVKSIENTNVLSSEKTIPKLNDNLLSTAHDNLNCDVDVNPCEIKIKPNNEEDNSFVTVDTPMSDIEKQSSPTLVSTNCLSDVRTIKPNKRTKKIMNLLNKNCDVQTKDELLEEDNKDNSHASQIDDTENHIVSDNLENYIDDTPIPIENVTVEIDVDKDLLPLHVCSLLDKDEDEDEMPEDVELDNNQSNLINANSHSTVCNINLMETIDIKTEEFNQCSSVNTDVYLSQNIDNIGNKEFDQTPSEINNECSPPNVYHEVESSSDVDVEEILNNDIENVPIVVEPCIVNGPVQKLYPSNSVRPINHSELRKKLRNVVSQRISNGGNKRQRLNDTYKFNGNLLHEYETNNRIEVNSVDFNENENIIYQNFDSPVISSVFSNYNGENIFNYDSNDIIELSSDEEEEGIVPIDTNSIERNFSTDVLNPPSIHIERCYSLDPNFSKRLQCNRTLQRVDAFYSSKISTVNSLSDNENLSENSQEEETVYCNISDIDSQNTEFSRQHITTCEEIEDLTQSDDDQDQINHENNDNSIDFVLDESNQHIFENLQSRFTNESDMVMYLMENYRMLYNGELLLSENANPHASDCIQYHIDRLNQLYGNPKLTNTTSVSFIRPLSTQLLSDQELPISSEHIHDSTPSYYSLSHSNSTTTTSTMHIPITVSKMNNSSSTITTIITDDELSDSSIESC